MVTTDLGISTTHSIASEFLGALARQDWIGVRSLLDPRVSFRVLTPRGLREADDEDGTIAWLTRWFGDADDVATGHSEISMMHDRLGISYRFRVHKDRWYVIEQRGYADVAAGKISGLTLVCSGFRPE